MLIHIVGAGVVGKATGGEFARFDNKVIYSDIDEWASQHDQSDLHFICTPEQTVPKVVQTLIEHEVRGDIVIRSTVPPRTTWETAYKINRPLWHNPEFLRAAIAEDDFLHSKYTLVGYANPIKDESPKLFDGYEATYGRMGIDPVLCSSTESELAKLITNSYLAMQISFWNEIEELSNNLGVNSHTVARLVTRDNRISHYGAYKHGSPYGGFCLPKDLKQLKDVSEQEGLNLFLFDAIEKVNSKMYQSFLYDLFS